MMEQGVGSSQLPAYTKEQVRQHNSESDCWVIVHGNVCDVTDFLRSHPGGVAALSKSGRGGCDVTSHFERIGHSAEARQTMLGLRIGSLKVLEEDPDVESGETIGLLQAAEGKNADRSLAEAELEIKEYAVRWHAARRKKILQAHPDVAELSGSNPWTLAIGLATVIVHAGVGVYVQNTSWISTLLAAYTIGALCKMYQFAVNHDICHGTAGRILTTSPLMKRIALHVCTLPSVGGAMHGYYGHQHIGHHASLGACSLHEIGGSPDDGKLPDMSKLFFAPDSDGDGLAVGPLSYGKILKQWRTRYLDADAVIDRTYIDQTESGRHLHDVHPLVKLVGASWGHFMHWTLMALGLTSAGLALNPITLPLLVIFKEPIFEWGWKHVFPEFAPASAESRDVTKRVARHLLDVACDVSLHTWLWGLLMFALLRSPPNGEITWGTVAKGLTYFVLSELFLYGFACHPFLGYFLGVHRSGGEGFRSETGADSTTACQPTMSTYSSFFSFCTLNLTLHVEHHDFPGIPWNRLPEVRRRAPEFYEGLEQSPGFLSTIYRWALHSKGWGYACQ